MDGGTDAFGIGIGSASTVFVTNSHIQYAYVGIATGDDANVTVRNTTIADSQLHSIVLGGNSSLDIRDSTIRNTFAHGIMVSSHGGTANLTVANTRFEGNFDGAALYFDAGATTVTSSTGNVDAITSGVRCMRENGTFTGGIGFSDNTVVTQANCPLVP
jgi:Right handed beta helix region